MSMFYSGLNLQVYSPPFFESLVSLGFFFLGERHSTTPPKVLCALFPRLASLASTPLFLGPGAMVIWG